MLDGLSNDVMKNLQRGQRFPLPDDAISISVAIGAEGSDLTFDVSCLGLDANAQLSDENFFIFYNQTCAPNQAIELFEGGENLAQFAVNLTELPPTIKKLVWVLTIDGQGSMSQLSKGYFRISSGEIVLADFDLAGDDFSSEKAIMVAELYERNGWRLSANG